jgi:hypothetical protein
MARLWSCGAELNSIAEVYSYISANVSISSDIKRSGSYSFYCLNAASDSYQQFETANANGPYYSRTYIYIHDAPSALCTILMFFNSSFVGKGRIRLNSNRTLELWDNVAQIGSDSSALDLDTWYCIEMYYYNNTTSGKLELSARINGAATFASTTTSTNTGGVYAYSFGDISGNASIEVYFDDIAVNNTTGTSQNSWPGAGSIVCLLPSASGDANSWQDNAGSAGTVNNYALVNEIPFETTTYIQSTTLNNEDLYNVSAMPENITSVNCVQVGYRFRRAGTSTCASFKAEILKTVGGTILQGNEITPTSTTITAHTTSTAKIYQLTAYTDPDSGNWTDSTLDTMQIGIKVSTDNTDTIRIYCIWALVDYVPSTTVGPTKLKTWNGLATAKIKTINGLAIAKVKTINGLT